MDQIEFSNVWKKFKKGERFNSLQEAIPNIFKKAFNVNNGNGLKKEEFWALQDVSFAIKKGEVVGIIGPNGAGKSTILKLLSRILAPNKGEIIISGRIGALIEITAGFHPDLTGRENVYLNGTIMGMTKREINSKFDLIVDFSGIGEFIDTPVKRYSSGMYSRLGFSVAAHMDPDILLVDEVLSVGDMAFQAKCTQKMRELMESGITIILVSHSLSLIQSLCKRVILLDKGNVVREGHPDVVIPFYQNIVYMAQEAELKETITTEDWKVKLNTELAVEVHDVYVLDYKRNPVEKLKFGDPIFINAVIESKEKIDNMIFSLEIVRSDGVLCCSSYTRGQQSLSIGFVGKRSIDVNLGTINLAPGIYMVDFSIWDSNMIHRYDRAIKDIFRIESKEVVNSNPIFLPEVKWKIN